jgi:hypothetical protein
MPRSIFLLSIMTAVAVCFACTQSPGPPIIKTVACNLKVQVLTQFYFPLPSNASYSPPTDNVQQNYQLRQQISDDLQSAVSNAPPKVQHDLCALTGVFIDSTPCSNGDVNNCQSAANAVPVSWGYRSPNTTDTGKMYIAIPGSLWAGGGNTYAIPLSTYEQNVLTYFALKAKNRYWGSSWYPLPTASANPDASWHQYSPHLPMS